MLPQHLFSGLLFAACLPACLLAQADAALTELCATIAPAISGKVTPGKALPLPKAEVLTRIAAVAPGKVDDAAVWRVEHAWPEDDATEARLVRMPVGDAAGRQIVLICARDHSMRGGAVLDNKGKLIASWNEFANQFAGKALPRLDFAVARTVVAKLIADAEGGKDENAKVTAALVDLRRQMLRQASTIGAVFTALEKGTVPPAAQVEATRVAFQAMAAHSADLAPILGTGAKDYAELNKSMVAALDALPAANTAELRQAALKDMQEDCRKCHELGSDKWRGEFEAFAGKERGRRGLADRVFLVGYDVMAAGVDGKDAQVLADAYYRAALVIDSSFQ